jgi:hypothetical protein
MRKKAEQTSSKTASDKHLPEPESRPDGQSDGFNGQSNSHLTVDVGTDSYPSATIRSVPDAAAVMALYKAHVHILVFKAFKAYEEALDSDDPRLKFASATKLLQGVGFFEGGGIDKMLRAMAAVGQTPEDRVLHTQAHILHMLRNKAEKYHFQLPKGL